METMPDIAASDARPVILTAELDASSQAWLDALRRAHFPPERNHLAAHLTLFHAVPAALAARAEADVREEAARVSPIAARASGWMPLGRGVAMRIEAPALAALRGRLAERWHEHLTAQDRGGFRAHVTVQNKVTPDAARALQAELEATEPPRAVTIEALTLWRYDGGPWERAARVPLHGAR